MTRRLSPAAWAHETAIRSARPARGIEIIDRGTAVQLRGPGVDLVAAHLRHVFPTDLEPFAGRSYDVSSISLGQAPRRGERDAT